MGQSSEHKNSLPQVSCMLTLRIPLERGSFKAGEEQHEQRLYFCCMDWFVSAVFHVKENK
jgi:hypothetical protein